MNTSLVTSPSIPSILKGNTSSGTESPSFTAPIESTRRSKRGRTLFSAEEDLKKLQNETVELALQLGKIQVQSFDSDVVFKNLRNCLNEQLADKSKQMVELQKTVQEENAKKARIEQEGLCISPSSVTSVNKVGQVRGAFKIHKYDAGIARHPLFYNLVKALACTSVKEMQEQMYSYEEIRDRFKPVDLNSVNSKEWQHLAKSFKKTADRSKISTGLTGRETFCSATLARKMNRFCNENSLPFEFTHQYPCFAAGSGKEDTCDIAAFYLDVERKEKETLLGLTEVKKEPSEAAKWQLCGYYSEAYKSGVLPKSTRISFGLTIDYTDVGLYGFAWNGTIRSLEHSLLWRESMHNLESGKILQAYFLCLAVLSVPAVRQGNLLNNFCPLVGKNVKVERHRRKVFRDVDNSTMYKVFEYGNFREEVRKPNKDFLEILYKSSSPQGVQSEGGNSAAVEISTAEYRGVQLGVQVLKTPWFEGDHQPSCSEHVALLCDQLQTLHDNNMKHSDVLCQNVLFGGSKTNPITNLIDFDFSHLQEYPDSWNDSFKERHPNAQETQDADQSHDVYAAIAILCMFFLEKNSNGEMKELYNEFADGPFAEEDHPELNSKWAKKSAREVAAWIRSNKTRLHLREDGTKVNKKITGTPIRKK